MSFPVPPPIASSSYSSNSSSESSDDKIYHQAYQAPALPFILVPLLPIIYCILWCSIHIGILYFKRRRQSFSASETPVLPVQVSVQPRQQQLQVLCRANRKGELNQDCPICLEEAEAEAEAGAGAEAETEEEAISWRWVPECNHRFHELCLNRWLKLSRTCPLCRVTTELEAFVAVV